MSAFAPIDTARRRQENQIYQQTYPVVVEYYSSKLRNYLKAKELALEAVGKVMTKLVDYDQKLPLQNWAMRIARNHLYDYYRQRASHKHQLVQPLGDLSLDEKGETPQSWFEDHAESSSDEDYQLLETGLMAQLAVWPGEEGCALRRHLLDGQDVELIALQLELKPKRVKRLLSEGKRRIREQVLWVEEVPSAVCV